MGLSTQLAHAQEPDPGTRVAARELAVSGAEAFDSQSYEAALDRFQRAESLYKVPSIAVMIARCLARLGRLVEAIDKYEATLRMPLGAGAPEAFQRAVADASREVEQVRARVARLELRPPSDVPSGLELELDGKPVPPALWGVATPVDPGVHRVTASARGREPYAYDVVLAEGAQLGVDISLPESRSATPASQRAAAERHARDARRSHIGWGLVGGGGAAIVVGTVTGILALGQQSKLDEACRPGCPRESKDDLDGFRRNRALSYVSFGVGLAAAGAGAYWILSESSSGEQIVAKVSPVGATLEGRF